ncbi:unnamed protein product, partial [Chrysoparadoxa australica]
APDRSLSVGRGSGGKRSRVAPLSESCAGDTQGSDSGPGSHTTRNDATSTLRMVPPKQQMQAPAQVKGFVPPRKISLVEETRHGPETTLGEGSGSGPP